MVVVGIKRDNDCNMPRTADKVGELSYVSSFPQRERDPSQKDQGQTEDATHTRDPHSCCKHTGSGSAAGRYLPSQLL